MLLVQHYLFLSVYKIDFSFNNENSNLKKLIKYMHFELVILKKYESDILLTGIVIDMTVMVLCSISSGDSKRSVIRKERERFRDVPVNIR